MLIIFRVAFTVRGKVRHLAVPIVPQVARVLSGASVEEHEDFFSQQKRRCCCAFLESVTCGVQQRTFVIFTPRNPGTCLLHCNEVHLSSVS